MTPQKRLSPLVHRMPGSHEATKGAYKFLEGAHASVNSLLDALEVVRGAKRGESDETRGRLSNDETELLRAAIVFTSSGLDATLHRLVRDALPLLAVDTSKGSYVKFTNYRRDEVRKAAMPRQEFVDAVLSDDPLDAMMKDWVEDRARGSYQGTSDLKKRVREPLGISKDSIEDTRIDSLGTFFKARNQVSHDMDYKSPDSGTARNIRRLGATISECDSVFSLANDFIHETARQLR
jgi:hypothetical protein